jgi:DNA-binding XRE family transcriptional regulator
MEMKSIQVFQLSIEDLSLIISEAVANELKKVNNLISPKPIPKENELLTRKETSKLLNVSYTTLFNWNREKVLEAKKLGNKVFYLKSEVFNKINNVA